ncbi:hypothetical protein M441DRAFT_31871 [Trichoderma asperellum CBS 433.97]|uniref:Uncharacterized protein n=1 Tax=Trichoderma asperellum (strain ATCC 204424 / CBS 433.97 / NBRC 101777) TaxID=1042311 RepID=A0A2T3YSW5_TRIA4|nr:hypothetical protein M441DRAFT_31871 [Trichoderma asperellum CBS 433.97]PTB35670.1 hypothetical protein M441DRAFT_31871 [Trichoderma asperellum CBS 433.97]
MTTPKGAAQTSKSQPHPSAPGPVTDTTEAPPQSLLTKQHNLVPMVVGTGDNQQNTMPLEGAEKEVLIERVHNTGAQTPSSLAAQIERELQKKSST